MLTYYGSRSTAYTWKLSNTVQYADENFAREIMQLFSIGMYKLRQDGSQILDSNGAPIRAYTNDEIVEYARAWTGFEARIYRGNIEIPLWNHVDPMKINIDIRDVFPKMGLDRKYIGEGYPLCSDLPEKAFLKAGATYRLLGSTSHPELVTIPKKWATDPKAKRVQLQPNVLSSLFGKLCGSSDPKSCNFRSKVVLDSDIVCSDNIECSVETLQVVEVIPGIFYEYTRSPCVYQAFYKDPRAIFRRKHTSEIMCADPRTIEAYVACCGANGNYWDEFVSLDLDIVFMCVIYLLVLIMANFYYEQYWGEKTSLAAANKRCNQQLCNRSQKPSCDASNLNLGTLCEDNGYYWSTAPCTLQAKVKNDGTVAIVHSFDKREPNAVMKHVHNDTKTFFRVDWSSEGYEFIVSSCNNIPYCTLSIDEVCVCDVTVEEKQVYFDRDRPSADDILRELRIGAFDTSLTQSSWVTESYNDVKVYMMNGQLTANSIFEVLDTNGVRHLRKNLKSLVRFQGAETSFRNPVHFISLSDPALHQAQDETDAALDHYFYHPNTAPFLAIRFIQRFGISNPSPGYVSRVAAAFKLGIYTFTQGAINITYGNGKYGNLGSMIASLLLDREARSILLDADPTHGSFKEPLLKVIGLMRALDFRLYEDVGFVDFDVSINLKIGQMAHALPSVFSFFSPFYTTGFVGEASLVVPEVQVMTGPRNVDFINGLLSMIKYGLSSCYGGLGRYQWWTPYDCSKYTVGGINDGSLGSLTFTPPDGSSAIQVTKELATLLTAGRLSRTSRDFISQIIGSEPNITIGVKKAQQLIITSPEFHTTNIIRKSGATRPEVEAPKASSKAYKAIVYVFLEGGMDSFNLLVPHTCSETNSEGQTLLEQYNAERTILALESHERYRVINADGQPCSQFVVNKDLEIVERLYKAGDLAFFANVGVLNQPVNQNNYYVVTKTALFGHNTMLDETQKLDPYEKSPGTGMLGRMCDVLKRLGYNSQPISIQDASVATVGLPGSGPEPLIVSAYETTRFNPLSSSESFTVRPYVMTLNNGTKFQSSLYGELWSQRLQKALFDNELILKALAASNLATSFSSADYSAKFKAVASLISSFQQRGTDRDVFYVPLGSWDHHSDLKVSLSANFIKLNEALTAFSNEMKAQGQWNTVTVVLTSEFSRTLTANSGKGSDHAWGGNYFMMGGAVKGGKIYGSYPRDITPAGPLNVGRGRLIPTLSWESMMNAMIQWMGVETEADLEYCMPNRKRAGAPLFYVTDIFENIAGFPTSSPFSVTNLPTMNPTLKPSQNPTNSPTIQPTLKPSENPTVNPTISPTLLPSESPTNSPTFELSKSPTSSPTLNPTLELSKSPTNSPTTISSDSPTPIPTFTLISNNTIDCPLAPNSIDFEFNGPVRFSIPSSSESICVLHQITSSSEVFKPVGRTYAGNAWEASSGDFSTLAWYCTTAHCTVDLPILPSGSAYRVTSFSPPEIFRDDGRDEIARFLEQATFGITQSDLLLFNTNNLIKSFGEWIKEQQDVIPMTSHRAYFRKRSNARMETATRNGPVTHPCQKGTTYRRFAFSMKDSEKYLEIKTFGNKKIIRMDGFVRTVVEGEITGGWQDIIWRDGR
jgi:uncharacterized protein (DUF1501 family)